MLDDKNLIPSWQLTYPFPKSPLKMIFLFQRWDMLVPYRVIYFHFEESVVIILSSSKNRVRPRSALHLPLLLHHLVALGCEEFPYHKLAKESQLLWKTDLPVKIILAANFLAQLLLHHPHLLMTETATHAKIHQIIPFNSTKTTWKVDEIPWCGLFMMAAPYWSNFGMLQNAMTFNLISRTLDIIGLGRETWMAHFAKLHISKQLEWPYRKSNKVWQETWFLHIFAESLSCSFLFIRLESRISSLVETA